MGMGYKLDAPSGERSGHAEGLGSAQHLPHQLPQSGFTYFLPTHLLGYGVWVCESNRIGSQPPPQPKSADYLGDMDLPPSDEEEEFEADETERRDVDLSKMETDKDAKKKAIKEAQKAARIAAEKAAAMVDEDDAFTVRVLRVGRSNRRRTGVEWGRGGEERGSGRGGGCSVGCGGWMLWRSVRAAGAECRGRTERRDGGERGEGRGAVRA